MKKKRKTNTIATPTTAGYKRWLWLAPVLVITALVYSGIGELGFQTHWDDQEQVINNATIRQISGQNLKRMFSDYVIGMYQPLTSLSYAIDYQISGSDPSWFHQTNLLLHLLNAALVWLLALRLFKREDLATIVALFFALHPMQVETVSWISTRSNLLFTSFFLGGLMFYTRYRDGGAKIAFAWALCLMLLSCLSKSMAVTFPLALVCLDYLAGRRDWKKIALEKAPFFALSIVFGLVALSYTEPTEIALDTEAGLLDRFFFVTYSFHFYITHLLLPTSLSAAHYFPVGEGLPMIYYLSPLTLLITVLPGVFFSTIRRPYFFGLAFFVFTIALVAVVPGRRTIVAERYVYLPAFGLFFSLITLGHHFIRTKVSDKGWNYPLLIMAGLLAIPAAAATAKRKSVWESSYTLFQDVGKKYPENYHSYAVRGLYLIQANQPEEALRFMEQAIERKPDYHEGHYNLGILYSDHLQQPNQAVKKYSDAIALKPKEPKYFIARGTVLGQLKKYSEAEADFAKALELDPQSARAFENRGVIRTDQKQYQDAIADYTKSIEHDPNNPNTYVSRGAAYSFTEDHTAAIADYKTALEMSPNNAQAYFNLGVSQFKTGDKAAACASWRKASNLGHPTAGGTVSAYCKDG